MSNQIFFMSDSHFGHQNMVKGSSNWEDTSPCRDFLSLEEHDEKLIENINKKVKEKDCLFHLGDWSFGGIENVYKFRKRLHCRNIHLILGNHDIHIQKNHPVRTNHKTIPCRELFSTVKDYDTVRIAGRDFILFHYPIYAWWKKKNVPRSSIHLYGHVHGTMRQYHPFAIEVGMDAHPEFRPFHLDEILQQAEFNHKHWQFNDHHINNDR
jgi:calcineurin-like phosphoesterase family protein